ncbi:MAG: molybdopterin-dependent oxidoreductase [Caulobacteraceae bacterium]|nr:molybdopterin-dependent oxidoreductase [Caulobacteraceae bacterium]
MKPRSIAPLLTAPILAALALAAAPAAAQTSPPAAPAPTSAPAPGSVTIKGPGGVSAVVSATDLRDMHRFSVTVPWGGGHTYAGAALSDLLAEVGAPSEARLHGPPLDQVVIVKGRDGFIAVLAMAETAMSFKGQPVILADTEDGKPLNDKEGPYRLVIGGELKPPRSVWGVVGIELRPVK